MVMSVMSSCSSSLVIVFRNPSLFETVHLLDTTVKNKAKEEPGVANVKRGKCKNNNAPVSFLLDNFFFKFHPLVSCRRDMGK